MRQTADPHAGFAPVRRAEPPPEDRARDDAQVELLREALAGRDAYARQQVKAKVAEVDARARRAACR